MAAGFHLLGTVSVEEAELVPISSISGSAGDLLELDIGAVAWTKADASTEHWQKKFVTLEAYTTADTFVKGIHVVPGQRWVAQVVNNSAAADNGDRMLLTDENTVNNTGTDNTSEEAVFIQISPIGAATEKLVLGEIVYGTGINPDAS